MPADVRAIVAQAAQRHGVDPTVLLRIAELESGLNPAARNPNSSAGGLFQFIDGTAAAYGLTDRFDPAASADAAARLARDNRAALSRRLGREPTPAEIYLAHQQGAAGAARLIQTPDAPVATVVGDRAAALNAGRPDMTAGQFVAHWGERFGGRRGAPVEGGSGAARPGTPAAPLPPAAPAADPSLMQALAPAAPQMSAPGPALAEMFQPARMPSAERARREQARRRAMFA